MNDNISKILNLTAAECENLIRQRPETRNGSVSSYELAPLGEGRNGILGEHFILQVKVKDFQKNVTFFVKTVPQMESMMFFTEHINVSYKEESFYQKIVPAMRKMGVDLIDRVKPACYMIRESQFLIFENLSALDYKIYPSRYPLPYEAVKVGLRTLAKFHACSFIYEERMSEERGREFRITDQFSKELEESFYCEKIPSKKLVESFTKGVATQLELFPDLYEDLNEQSFKDFVLDTCRNIQKFTRPSEKFRNIICHGDVWSTNLMFKEKDSISTECLLIDFQLQRYSPPAQDVMMFFYLTTCREFRRKNMSECLDFYYASLSESLNEYHVKIEEVLSESDFRSSCDHYEVYGMTQCLGYSNLTKAKPDVIKELFDSTEDSNRFMYVDRSDSLIRFCANDPYYKNKQRDSLLHFKDVFMGL